MFSIVKKSSKKIHVYERFVPITPRSGWRVVYFVNKEMRAHYTIYGPDYEVGLATLALRRQLRNYAVRVDDNLPLEIFYAGERIWRGKQQNSWWINIRLALAPIC